jgi:hypothetical protein
MRKKEFRGENRCDLYEMPPKNQEKGEIRRRIKRKERV